MITNIDPSNGIHYGTIYANHIAFEAADDLINCGTDLDYEKGLEHIKEDFISHMEIFCEDNYITFKQLNVDDLWNQIEDNYINNNYGAYDATYRYERDGYIIEFHTYDNSLIIFKSPYVCYAAPCSPCFPNGGYIKDKGSLLTYALGADWYDDDENTPLTNEVFLLSEIEEEE